MYKNGAVSRKKALDGMGSLCCAAIIHLFFHIYRARTSPWTVDVVDSPEGDRTGRPLREQDHTWASKADKTATVLLEHHRHQWSLTFVFTPSFSAELAKRAHENVPNQLGSP